MTALITVFAVLLVAAGYLVSPAAPCSNLWHAQVEHDIHQFKTTHGKVTRASLDEAQTEILSGFRILILNNTLYAIPQGWQAREAFAHTSRGAPHAALLLILKALCRYRMPDVEFVMNIQAERATAHALHSTPVFSYSKDSRNPRWAFLYPSWNVLWPTVTRAQLAANSVPWKDKVAKAVWRGAPSNGALTPFGWQHTARTKLVMNCRQRPDLCDAGFYDYQKGRINDHETRRILKQVSPLLLSSRSNTFQGAPCYCRQHPCAMIDYHWQFSWCSSVATTHQLSCQIAPCLHAGIWSL